LGAAWVGWSGDKGDHEPFGLDGDLTYVPVSLSPHDVRNHYEGLSNGTIWPLFHQVGVPHDYRPEWWDSYAAVNEAFAAQVASVTAADGTVWINDYHLMLAPDALRRHRPDVGIGYFHHIPFPSADVLDRTHHAAAVVAGLLGADLIGFQRQGDRENFVDCVRRFAPGALIEADSVTAGLGDGARVTRVGVYPISIDFGAVADMAATAAVVGLAAEYRKEWDNPQTVFLGVDRIDYTKGIPERLEAFERLLETGALSAEDVVFVQAGSPSRQSVEAYQDIASRVANLVQRINARFPARSGRGPVVYMAENLPRETMMGLFVAADVMVVSALADGMNLVAKEFVASRVENTGVLVLSTATGAADELTQAQLVDPRDIDALAAAMLAGVTMSATAAEVSMRAMRERVSAHDVQAWSGSFLRDLEMHARGDGA
jgi:trehalose 6-phosphate synthase